MVRESGARIEFGCLFLSRTKGDFINRKLLCLKGQNKTFFKDKSVIKENDLKKKRSLGFGRF